MTRRVDSVQILKHLDQLTPVLRANIEVIRVLQAGIIGICGEFGSADQCSSLGLVLPHFWWSLRI